jgi:phosphoribosylaminoimidazolecarboxamide formyltransferase/IMP cyclohydrolase
MFFQKLHGKELSYNNILDIQSAVDLVEEFDEPTTAIVKHTNPCGVGSAAILCEAYQKAFVTDTTSAFGGIVAVNRPIDLATAELIDKIFTEVIIAPGYLPDAEKFLMKKKDRRLMKQLKPLHAQRRFIIEQTTPGVLVQTQDRELYNPDDLRVVTRRSPTSEERAAMEFGWRVAKHVKSNAIVYSRSDRTLGIGAGQMSRLDSARIAVLKARDAGISLGGTAVASDAFFPFADGLLEAVRAGATAVIQPGGSVRDQEVINAANDNNIAMLFTGMRHFRH